MTYTYGPLRNCRALTIDVRQERELHYGDPRAFDRRFWNRPRVNIRIDVEDASPELVDRIRDLVRALADDDSVDRGRASAGPPLPVVHEAAALPPNVALLAAHPAHPELPTAQREIAAILLDDEEEETC